MTTLADCYITHTHTHIHYGVLHERMVSGTGFLCRILLHDSLLVLSFTYPCVYLSAKLFSSFLFGCMFMKLELWHFSVIFFLGTTISGESILKLAALDALSGTHLSLLSLGDFTCI